MIDNYVKLRDKKKECDDAHSQRMAPLVAAMDQLEGAMLTMLNDTGQDSAKTAAGTVYRTTKQSASIADKDAFMRHVIGTEAWEFLDAKANVTAVAKTIEDTGEPPPGVNWSSRVIVGVRRANGNK